MGSVAGFAVHFTQALCLAVLAALERDDLHRPAALAAALDEPEWIAFRRLRRLASAAHAYPSVLDDITVVTVALQLPVRVTVSMDDRWHATAAEGSLPWSAAGDALADRCAADDLWDPVLLADATGLASSWVEDVMLRVDEGRAAIGEVSLLGERLGVAMHVAVRVDDAEFTTVDGAE